MNLLVKNKARNQKHKPIVNAITACYLNRKEKIKKENRIKKNYIQQKRLFHYI